MVVRFLYLPQNKLSGPINQLWHKLDAHNKSMYVHLITIHNIFGELSLLNDFMAS